MFLDPPSNWCLFPDGGFDLRGIRTIQWEARSLRGDVNVEFVIGGVKWKWDETEKEIQVCEPSSIDSMPRDGLGIYKLTDTWQEFRVDLTGHPESDFQCLVGGFGWVIGWGSNGVYLDEKQTEAEQPKTFTIELRNIRYER
jgi:hypothetical protein